MEQKVKAVNVNRSVLLAVTMVSNFFNPLMGSAINVALPKIGEEFSMNAVLMTWVSMSYLLSSAVFLLPFGKIGDMWGRKKLFLYGNIFFACATLLCAFSFSGVMLVSARLLQGIGSAMMLSTSMAIVISAFPPSERGKVIGLNVSAVYVGLSASPILGGVLTQSLGWKSIFYINFIAEIFIISGIILKIKDDWKEDEKETFDIKGSLIYMAAVSILMLGFSNLPERLAAISTFIGFAGILLFAAIEKKAQFPILNMKLFSENKVFALSNLSAFVNYAATFSVTFILSLYLQYAKGLTPRETGLTLVAQPAMMALIASFSGRLSDRMDPRILSSLGMAISVVGLFLLSFIGLDTSIQYIVASLVVLGTGFGMFSSPNTNAIMSSVERRYYGVASATLATMRITGMMFSMAVASLSIHIFIGESIINERNIHSFIISSKLVLVIFTVLCLAGVFTSLVGIKRKR